MNLLRRKSERFPRCAWIRKSNANKSSGCERCAASEIQGRRKSPLPSSSAAPRQKKIFCPPFLEPLKHTRPSEKFRIRCAAPSANTGNPSSSEPEHLLGLPL